MWLSLQGARPAGINVLGVFLGFSAPIWRPYQSEEGQSAPLSLLRGGQAAKRAHEVTAVRWSALTAREIALFLRQLTGNSQPFLFRGRSHIAQRQLRITIRVEAVEE